MLKLLPRFNFNSQAKTKCGEIFCHNTTDFTVYCSFCEMKSFSLEDFLHHLKNVHFSKDLCKSEMATNNFHYFDGFSKDACKFENDEENVYNGLIQSCDDSDNEGVENGLDNDKEFSDEDSYDNASYDEPITILKKSQTIKSHSIKDSKYPKRDNDDGVCNNFEVADQYQPVLSDNVYSCRKCGETFKSVSLLKTHFYRLHVNSDEKKKESTGKKISCNECDQIFPFKKSLYSHIVEYHLGFKCSMCDKRFKQLQQRDRHEFCHTAKRVFTCKIEGCDKSFTHKYYLQRHIDSHNKERKFVCDFENCSKAFHTLRCLKAHKNRHTKPKNLICDTCGYTCREYDRLRIHQRVHTGEKPYGCQECGKRFTSNAALLEHSVSHTGIRSHVCINCNTTFTRQKSLYQHRLKCTNTTAESTT